MRLSKMYLKTYKEFPYENALDSTKLLYRSGLVKFFEDASFSYTPMGKLFADNLKDNICRKLGGYMDIEIACAEKRCVGAYAAELKSYKELPLNLSYQMSYENENYKFKDGLLNPRTERILKFVSFSDGESASEKYEMLKESAADIFRLAGIEAGAAEDEKSIKFFKKTPYPLESFAVCGKCGYGGRADELKTSFEADLSTGQEMPLEHVHTPGVGSIADLEEFFGVAASEFVKTLLFDVNGEIVAVLLRGDKSISKKLLAQHLGVGEEAVFLASESQVNEATSAMVGFAGPIGLKADRLLCDEQVCDMKSFIVGANKTDYHIKNVNYKRDFEVDEIGVFRVASEGDLCPNDSQALDIVEGSCLSGIELAAQKSKYLNEAGKEEVLFCVSAQFNMDRIMAAIAESNNDEHGIVWPDGYAPFEYYIIIGNAKNEDETEAGERLYADLSKRGINVILDDRKERIGSKFKDSELLGIKKILVAGKLVKEGKVEVKCRKSLESEQVLIEEFLNELE